MFWAARTSSEVVMNALKKIIRTLKLDVMTPEFKAANAELLKAIKMNDKSGAVPHADLEAVNKAMKANDAEKVGTALKKVQLQFSKAEKKLDDEVKDVTARLAEAKNAVEKNKADMKASKADASLFDKARKAADGIKANPRNASKLSPIADKLKRYGDLSKRVSQIVTLAASNKDVSKQVDMLKKAIDIAENKYKKESANVEKEAKKAKDELDVLNMRVKVTQGKKDAFTKERLYIANVVKQMPEGDLRQKESNNSKINNELDKLIQKGKRLYESLESTKADLKGLYEADTKFMADLRKQTRDIDKNAVKGMKAAAKKIKNEFLTHELLSIVERFENDKYAVIGTELDRLRYNFDEYSKKTNSKDERKIYANASDACKNILSVYDKWKQEHNDLAKEYKRASQMVSRPDLDVSSRTRLFNKILKESISDYELQIVELLHKCGQLGATKPAKNFEEFKKWMMIGAERIKNDIV